jgi:ABC-type phosphate/phosphonate transport system ATPase subunit
MLTIERLHKSFAAASRQVLRDISLHIEPGEYVAIVGESGSGKSTLLNLIAGLDTPDVGRIVLNGQDLAQLDDTARTLLRRVSMGFVFQAFHLLPHLTTASLVLQRSSALMNCWPQSVCLIIEMISQRACRAVKCSAQRWRVRWCTDRNWFSRMNLPAISMRRLRPKCWNCCALN